MAPGRVPPRTTSALVKMLLVTERHHVVPPLRAQRRVAAAKALGVAVSRPVLALNVDLSPKRSKGRQTLCPLRVG